MLPRVCACVRVCAAQDFVSVAQMIGRVIISERTLEEKTIAPLQSGYAGGVFPLCSAPLVRATH